MAHFHKNFDIHGDHDHANQRSHQNPEEHVDEQLQVEAKEGEWDEVIDGKSKQSQAGAHSNHSPAKQQHGPLSQQPQTEMRRAPTKRCDGLLPAQFHTLQQWTWDDRNPTHPAVMKTWQNKWGRWTR
jgi:hypothetical protein